VLLRSDQRIAGAASVLFARSVRDNLRAAQIAIRTLRQRRLDRIRRDAAVS
jgi:hypothetical protein